DWLEVTGPDGTVLARGHDRGNFGVSLAGDALVSSALAGRPLAAVTALSPPDTGLALLAASPVVFEGKILGAVRGGVRLDQTFVQRLKALPTADLAVFGAHGEGLASTFPGARLPSVDTSATAEVSIGGGPYRIGAVGLSGVHD